MHNPKKKFGQHFLWDKDIIEQIIAHAELTDSDIVWEIGPGLGALTDKLIEKEIDLTIFEIDDDLIDLLKKKYSQDCRIVHDDILKMNWKDEISKHRKPIKIVTNLPYQISSPFLYKLTENDTAFESIVVMLQKEVALRLCAKAGKKDYGVLTLKTQYYFTPTYLFGVSPDKFSPPPEVESAVIKLVPRTEKPEIKDIKFFWQVVEAAFSSRRKTLRNNLLKLFKETARPSLAKAFLDTIPMDLGRRGETFSEKEFIALHQYLL